MVINHADGLHIGIHNGWSDKGHAPFFQIFGQSFGFGRLRGHIFRLDPMIDFWHSADKAPQIRIKRPEFLLNLPENSRIPARGKNLQTIADDLKMTDGGLRYNKQL